MLARFGRAAAVILAALTAILTTAAAGAPPPVTDGAGHVGRWERDPHPRLRAVADESARHGWPHAATRREARAVAYLLAHREIPRGSGQSGAVLCRPIRVHAGFWLCGVRVFQPDFDADGRTWSYPLVVTVGHDGRWRATVPGDRYLKAGSRVIGATEVNR